MSSRTGCSVTKQRMLPGIEFRPDGSGAGLSTLRSLDNNSRLDNRVNVRVSANDVSVLKALALAEGLSYQALLATIIRDYVGTGPLPGKGII